MLLTGVDMGGGIKRLSKSALDDAETVFEASYIIIMLDLFNNYQVLKERVKSKYSLIEHSIKHCRTLNSFVNTNNDSECLLYKEYSP